MLSACHAIEAANPERYPARSPTRKV